MDLVDVIDKRIGEVRFDTIDLSFGEISSLYKNSELVIQPEYQRLFRWSDDQKSRLVESILLELPIPQIFVIENESGVLELIDGLQRVSSVIQFMDAPSLKLEPLVLSGCDLVPELNGIDFETLPLKLRLQLRRSAVRTVIIKRQSQSFLRYEMFKRLNTGGASLSHQEVRNCSARMLEEGTKFYEFIQKLASTSYYKSTTSSISSTDFDQKGDEELVLRYLALKNSMGTYKGSVKDWLDGYMEDVIFKKIEFDYSKEEAEFKALFGFIDECMADTAFVKWRNSQPIGSLAPAYFEAVTAGFRQQYQKLQKVDKSKIKLAVASGVESQAFKSFTGPGANSRPKLEGRIAVISNTLGKL